MRRRDFLRLTGACAAAGLLPGRLARAIEGEGRPRNVLFVAVDDLRSELGCYGASCMKTP